MLIGETDMHINNISLQVYGLIEICKIGMELWYGGEECGVLFHLNIPAKQKGV
jgi:hypothetical protein